MDSTGANFNRYWYANNGPLTWTDPDGRDPIWSPQALLRQIGEGVSSKAESVGAAAKEALPRVLQGASGAADMVLGSVQAVAGGGLVAASPTTFGASAVAGGLLATNGALTFVDGAITILNAIDGKDRLSIEGKVGQAIGGETGAQVGELVGAARTVNGARSAAMDLVESPSARGAAKSAYETATAGDAVKKITNEGDR